MSSDNANTNTNNGSTPARRRPQRQAALESPYGGNRPTGTTNTSATNTSATNTSANTNNRGRRLRDLADATAFPGTLDSAASTGVRANGGATLALTPGAGAGTGTASAGRRGGSATDDDEDPFVVDEDGRIVATTAGRRVTNQDRLARMAAQLDEETAATNRYNSRCLAALEDGFAANNVAIAELQQGQEAERERRRREHEAYLAYLKKKLAAAKKKAYARERRTKKRIDSIRAIAKEDKADVERFEEELDERIDVVKGRVDGIEGRLDEVEGRLDEVEGRLDEVQGQVAQLVLNAQDSESDDADDAEEDDSESEEEEG